MRSENSTIFYALFGICFYASAFINAVDGNNNCPESGFEIIVPEYIADNGCEATDNLTDLNIHIVYDNGLNSNVSYDVFCQKHNGSFNGVIHANIFIGLFSSSTLKLDITFPDIAQAFSTPDGLTEVIGKSLGFIGSNRITCVHSIHYSPGITNTPKPAKASFNIKCSFVEKPIIWC